MGDLDKDIIINKIREEEAVIRGFGIRYLGLFGSFSRGESGPESDIDLLYEFEPDHARMKNYFGLLGFLEDLFDRRIELAPRLDLSPHVRPYILQDVEPIIGPAEEEDVELVWPS